MNVDLDGFRVSMEKQRERARAARVETVPSDSFKVCTAYSGDKTKFTGYGNLSARSQITAIIADGSEKVKAIQGEQVQVILDQTPFYSEGGGQVGDEGNFVPLMVKL